MGKKRFFYGQVEGDFIDTETYGLALKINRLTAELRGELPPEYEGDPFVSGYCEAVVYTRSLAFDWRDDVRAEYPDYLNLQRWWDEYASKGNAITKPAYLFFIESVPWDIITEWREAYRSALKSYVPPELRIEDDLTDAERADPNSKPAASKRGGKP